MRLKYENVTQFYSTHFNPMFHFYTPPKSSENKRCSPVLREGGGGGGGAQKWDIGLKINASTLLPLT